MRARISRRTMLAGGTASLLATPWVARAQANTLRIGMQSILSGPIALLGTSSRNALTMEQDRINAARVLYSRTTDPQNFLKVLDTFSFDSGRQAVLEQLGLK